MISHLSVENYALIDRLEMDFGAGLNIITGETGAGKSILLGAVGLLLGEKGDAGVLRDPERNCVVEGVFDIASLDMEEFFEENDLDYNPSTTIRRVINASGKSRAYVNDLPVQQAVLKLLGHKLIDIHSQHQNLLLRADDFRIGVVDGVAAHDDVLERYRWIFASMNEARRKLAALREQAAASARDAEYLSFQSQELTAAALCDGEQEQIEEQLGELLGADAIRDALQQTVFGLSEDETGILPRLKSYYNAFVSSAKQYSKATEFARRLDSVILELRDLQNEAEHEAQRIEADPERAEKLSRRLDMIYALQQKHGVRSIGELIELQRDFTRRLSAIESCAEQISELEEQEKQLAAQAANLARQISENRRKAAPRIEAAVCDMLRRLGMQDVRFCVSVTPRENLRADGGDTVEFLFSANKTMTPRPVEKIASGGEISRVMLALKAVSAGSAGISTVIFDEIDTGVSGRVADAMGEIINEMAAGCQIINITHLPQVAAKGDRHFRVYKHDGKTGIEALDTESRVDEIAKMLSGSNVTDAAIRQARYLLGLPE